MKAATVASLVMFLGMSFWAIPNDARPASNSSATATTQSASTASGRDGSVHDISPACLEGGLNGYVSPVDRVNLRTGPSTSSRVITVMQPGLSIRIHSWRVLPDATWAWLTTAQGQSGWARSDFVSCTALD